jgi:hypothetical protein
MNTLTRTDAQQIADNIIAQLGGRRFMMMTGARHLTYSADGTLQFRLPSGSASGGINHVSIALNSYDLYDVTFRKVRGINSTEVASEKNVYNSDLQKVFTIHTGLYTSL